MRSIYGTGLITIIDMETAELRKKMMELWKNTFHDSDAYISLVFDTYFNTEYIEYYEENGKLISALLGIPYYFGNGKAKIQGLYLCGLATIGEYRHRGIMGKLLSRICDKALERGLSFAFLIPSSDMLRLYYSSRGFDNAMYVVEDRYTDIHSFDKDYRSVLSKENERVKMIKTKYYENLRAEILTENDGNIAEDVVEFIKKSEWSDNNYSTLLHDKKDCLAIIKENHISRGVILVCKNTEGAITGVLFATFDDRRRIIVPKVFYNDNCSYFKLLDKIKQLYPESSMSVVCFPEETERRVLWSPGYKASAGDGGVPGGSYGVAERVYDVNRHARPYGMVKVLDYREILKFLANDRKDCKFSIIVKEGINEKTALKCDVKDGEANFSEVPSENVASHSNKANITILSKRDLSEILFRKKDRNSLIMEALGIPRLSMNMALLLD